MHVVLYPFHGMAGRAQRLFPSNDHLPSWQRDKLLELIAQGHRRSAGIDLILEAPTGPPKLVRFTLKPLKNTPRHTVCVVATELTEFGGSQ